MLIKVKKTVHESTILQSKIYTTNHNPKHNRSALTLESPQERRLVVRPLPRLTFQNFWPRPWPVPRKRPTRLPRRPKRRNKPSRRRPSRPSFLMRPKKPVSLARLKSEFSQVLGTSEPLRFSGSGCDGIGLISSLNCHSFSGR